MFMYFLAKELNVRKLYAIAVAKAYYLGGENKTSNSLRRKTKEELLSV